MVKTGYIAIIGRPNVGKSTLLNKILGKKVSITSRKPQTTRKRIVGIKTQGDTQMIFIDTPGIHDDNHKIFNQMLNREALSALNEADCILWLLDAYHWNEDDTLVAEKLAHCSVPVLLVINKIDKLDSYDHVLPLVEKLAKQIPHADIIPVSAKKAFNLERLENIISQKLPENAFFYDKNTLTDNTDEFTASEFIREKLVRLLGDELPYAATVSIDQFEKTPKIIRIQSIIWVEKESQKGIVIGRGGEGLKKIGEQSRLAMEAYFEQKVFLQCWVKVKKIG